MPPPRIPSLPFPTRLFVCLFAVLISTSGCHQMWKATSSDKPVAADSTSVSSHVMYDAPGLPMTKRLEMIADNVNPAEVLNENRKKAEQLKAQLEGETDSQILFSVLPKYADELLSAGLTDESLKQYDRLEALAQKQNANMLAGNLSDMRRMQALAWLRLGEQENCLLNHTSESCLMPIQGGGIHKAQRGSRNAVKLYTKILQTDAKNLEARWLLNIAYMTLGEYPAKVPPKWVIPPSAFKSDADIGRFHDIAGGLGLDLHRLSGGTIIEDFDNDGNLDIMTSCIGVREALKLFHNNGDGTFTDISDKAGLKGEVGGLNILQTDYNNDGFVDALILRGAWYGRLGHWPLSLLKNNGNGTFTDVTEQAGLLHFRPTQTAFFFDYDSDGFLDLFVGNETRVTDDQNPCELFHNNGNGTFTECAKAVGLDYLGFVKGVVSADYNHDGRPDLYVSVQGHTNVLFRNDGPTEPLEKGKPTGWKFTDVTKQAGVEKPVNSFSCFFFDYDNDGWPDLFVTGYSFQEVDVGVVAADYLGMSSKADYPSLYHNNHDGTFTDVSKQAHVHKLMWGMGINYGDLDNDGWLDFYVGTGNPQLSFLTPNRMFHNAGGQFFHEVTTSGGFGHLQKGHGISFGDLNNDGQQDIYESMGGILDGDTSYNTLYENPGHDNHWVTLKVEGVQSNRAAIGAIIKVVTQEAGKERSIYKTVSTGGSFGASPLRQEIGLGKATAITRVEIFWPTTGKTQTLTGLALDRFYKVKEGDTTATPWDLKSFPYAKADPHAQHHHH